MINKKHKIIIFSLITLFAIGTFFVFTQNVQATNFTYEPMESIPGFENEDISDFPTLIESLYKFAMWVVGICALFMITVGGFSYMTSAGNTSKAAVGKSIITDAIIGLVLALITVLLFNVINPNITNINLQIAPADDTGGGATPPPANCTGTAPANSTICTSTNPTTETPISLVATCANAPCSYACKTNYKLEGGTCVSTSVSSGSLAEAATSLLANGNVTFAGSGDCSGSSGTVSPSSNMTQAQNGNCSTTCNGTCKSSGTLCSGCANLSVSLLDAINTVGTNNRLTVSSLGGGQHSTNSSHYKGTAADIVPSASKSEWASIVAEFKSAGCSSNQTFCDYNGTIVTDCTKANHIHVTC